MGALNTSQRYNAVLAITNNQGNPAPVQEGSIVWASSNDTVLTVTPSADGMSCVIDSVAPGTARVTVQADADLGEGVSNITGVSEDIEVTQDPNTVASTFSITLGDPQPKSP